MNRGMVSSLALGFAFLAMPLCSATSAEIQKSLGIKATANGQWVVDQILVSLVGEKPLPEGTAVLTVGDVDVALALVRAGVAVTDDGAVRGSRRQALLRAELAAYVPTHTPGEVLEMGPSANYNGSYFVLGGNLFGYGGGHHRPWTFQDASWRPRSLPSMWPGVVGPTWLPVSRSYFNSRR